MPEYSSFLKRFATVNPIILFVLIGSCSYAIYLHEINIVKGILLTIFGSLTAISFYKLFELITSGRDSVGVERSVPTIDGTVGGWKLTSALTMLIMTLSFAIITLMVSLNDFEKNHPKDKNQTKDQLVQDSKQKEPQGKNSLPKTDSNKLIIKDSVRIDTGKKKSS